MSDFESMTELPEQYRAVVVGASGAIGGAIADLLEGDARCGGVVRLSRSSGDFVDGLDEGALARAAEAVRDQMGEIHLLFIAVGGLSIDGRAPEKSLKDLAPEPLAAQFEANTIGPALILKHFSPLLARRARSFAAALSARVGSIGDNRLGGWYGYRSAKAALNQILHSAAIELRRTRPELVVAALHPGTVESPLSRPFRPGGAAEPNILTPKQSAASLLRVLNSLRPEQSGGFWDWKGEQPPW